jgi:hypothetical protein
MPGVRVWKEDAYSTLSKSTVSWYPHPFSYISERTLTGRLCSWASQAAELRRPKRVEGLPEHMLPTRSGGITGPGTFLTLGFREFLRAFLSLRSSKPAGKVAPDNQIPTTSLADPLHVEESHSVFGSMHSHSPLKAALAVWIGSLQPFVPARISA